MPQKLVAPKRLKLEKIARLTLQEIRYFTIVQKKSLQVPLDYITLHNKGITMLIPNPWLKVTSNPVSAQNAHPYQRLFLCSPGLCHQGTMIISDNLCTKIEDSILAL